MTRDEFTTEHAKRHGNVLQKFERMQLARAILATWGSTPERESAYAEARNNYVAAEDQLADFQWDALNQLHEFRAGRINSTNSTKARSAQPV